MPSVSQTLLKREGPLVVDRADPRPPACFESRRGFERGFVRVLLEAADAVLEDGEHQRLLAGQVAVAAVAPMELLGQHDLGREELREDLGIARARSGIARIGDLIECGCGFGRQVLRHRLVPSGAGMASASDGPASARRRATPSVRCDDRRVRVRKRWRETAALAAKSDT